MKTIDPTERTRAFAQPVMNDKNLNTRAPENDLGELAEKEASAEALVSLLRSAYPNPPPGMTGRIMERIRSESGGDAKLLPAADSRRSGRKNRGRGTWIRWSALAASILLVGTLGLSILPRLTRSLGVSKSTAADSAMPESARSPEELEEAADSYSLTSGGAAEMAVMKEEAAAGEAVEAVEEAAFEAVESPAELPAPEPEPAPASAYAVRGGEERAAVTASGAQDEGAQDNAALFDGAFAEPAAPMDEESVFYGLSTEEEWAAEAEAEADARYDFDEDGSAEDGLLSRKVFTLNGATGAGGANGWDGMDGFSAAEGEIPMMASGAMNSEAAGAEPRDMLTYYFVRTACAHADAFRNSYHDIPEVLIAKVGPELYGAWATKVQNEDLCGVNILSFAVRFGLTAEDIYATGDTWYFLDLPDGIPLTEENAGAVEQYYLDGGDFGKMVPRLAVYHLKTAMIREAGMDAYLAWRGTEERSLVSWTVAEGAAALGLSAGTMDRLADEALAKTAAEYGGEYLPAKSDVLGG